MIKAIPLLLIFVSSALSCASNRVEPNRPAEWATPVQLRGVANLFKVTDYLYRSEQPIEEGMKNLKELGIKTIINLRAFYSDSDKIKGTGLRVEELSVNVWHIEDADVVRVLRIIRKRENGPFLIHCSRGADRVGVMIAMFRVVEQGWTKEDAIQEMEHGGYGFRPLWFRIVGYVKHADVERIRKQVEK
ncbi:MAG TPA: tyrosine-protein phosphatase [Syntrophorhabdales bacterium]|nr:tyrosine-protein phosphatase [Syntrophorhabdales bacterium]